MGSLLEGRGVSVKVRILNIAEKVVRVNARGGAGDLPACLDAKFELLLLAQNVSVCRKLEAGWHEFAVHVLDSLLLHRVHAVVEHHEQHVPAVVVAGAWLTAGTLG